ncbi:MAG: DUF2087 domain-containing protein [Erysipelotrichia bacterium]|nr:DUF2087 domain-containing protein [Erysipelotrichia bacterium]
MKKSENLFDLPIETIKNAFTENQQYFSCLICGREIEKGIIYKEGEVFYEARRFMEMHISRAHNSVFEYLIGLDKKTTGLSEHQCELLRRFYQGMPDVQIQKELQIGSPSTVRNHRFALKEKERQAKIFMTLMELIRDKEKQPQKYVEPHQTATMIDDRYKITAEENEKVLKKYFPDGLDGQLTTFKLKEKSKLAVLRQIATRIAPKHKYTEKEINEILKTAYSDYVTIRRYLIEYGFLDRTPDCSAYWLR